MVDKSQLKGKHMQSSFQQLSKFGLVFGLTVAFAQSSSATSSGFYGRSEFFSDNYCVYNGFMWGFGEKRCVTKAAAEALGYDEAKIFGMASDQTPMSQLTRAQAELDNAKKVLATKQKESDKLSTDVKEVEEKLKGGGTPPTGYELDKLDARLASLKKDQERAGREFGEAKAALDGINTRITTTTAAGNPDAAILKAEITKRGLVAKFNEYERVLVDFQTGIQATESELNNTALEALVVAKLNKLSGNLCEAAKMCGPNFDNKEAVKTWLTDQVASEELKKSFKKATPAPAAEPARK